jgi:hypothetical protein
MNIIAIRQEKRAKIISQITESIKASKSFSENTVNFKKVVLATMANLNLSQRTAREYVEVAFFNLGIDK